MRGRKKKKEKGEKKDSLFHDEGLHEDSIFPDALRANMKTRLFRERDSEKKKKKKKKKRIISRRRAIKNGRGKSEGRGEISAAR